MKLGTIQTAVVFLLSFVLSQPALADYGALAIAKDGSYGWSSRPSQKEAAREALKTCNEFTPEKNCAIAHTKAIATAAGKDVAAMGFSPLGVADARRLVLARCGTGCKVGEIITTPGFYARAVSEKDANGRTHGHLGYGNDDRDDVVRRAIKACTVKAGVKCEVAEWGVIPGRIKPPTPDVPALTSHPQNCRPTTPVVRCQSQCENGSCTVTYENGCRMRVQVQPRFDGFANQWVYPSPAC